ncbi:MAG TPA: HAD family hydrolase [Patescibacteria group bacterium]|nr:HAD family hydrolase [Patescibacteria group bacterium]
MIENREHLIPKNIVFFDADKTLWQVITTDGSDDWSSKVKNATFLLDDGNTVTRKENGTKFVLKDEVKECLEKLSKEGIGIGLISDNEPEDVKKITDLFGISEFFDSKLINVSLWEGPCPKEVMITEVVEKIGSENFSRVLLVDDKDYSEAMKNSGYSFIQSPKDSFPKEIVLDYFGLK